MVVSPNDVLQLTEPTKGFLCPLSANRYGIEFLSFSIQDYESKEYLFELRNDDDDLQEICEEIPFDEDSLRRVKYNFNERVLRLPRISTSLTFKVGKEELPNFRMVERHYFRNRLVKSYDFTFGFCIPESTNTWDAVYNIPPLEDELIEDMVRHPFETHSDSFYFVDDEMIMHNKASYKYTDTGDERFIEAVLSNDIDVEGKLKI